MHNIYNKAYNHYYFFWVKSDFSLTKEKKRLHFFLVKSLYFCLFSSLHTPVLFGSVRDTFLALSPRPRVVVDATLWLWGHAGMLCDSMEGGTFIGFDRDAENLDRASVYLENRSPHINKKYVPQSFTSLRDELGKFDVTGIDFILYDLWVSSVHLDDSDRGFSLRFDGPLDMRFDRSHGKTASDIVMSLDAIELAQIFMLYGEEKKSWFVASEIVKVRKTKKIDTTFKLLEIIKSSSFDQKSPLRVFQALRIFVNDEFAHIEDSLAQALSLLRPGGVMMVITFHSLEDRLVKQLFAKYLKDEIDQVTGQIRERSQFAKYTKKPIIPTEEEIYINPRSRSAKLRVIQKIISKK